MLSIAASGDCVRSRHAAKRDRACHLDDFRLAAAMARLGCIREPGRDRIDPDAVGGELQRHRPGQLQDAALARHSSVPSSSAGQGADLVGHRVTAAKITTRHGAAVKQVRASCWRPAASLGKARPRARSPSSAVSSALGLQRISRATPGQPIAHGGVPGERASQLAESSSAASRAQDNQP